MTYQTIIIGTGFSGICMAIKLKEKGIHDFVILEKSKDLGGTWRDNTYPGAECDIPSALYSYSFEPYPEWEYKWSMQPQILKYINYVVDKYGIRKHILYNKELIQAIWNEEEGLWTVGAADQSNYQTQNVVTALGQLHHPSIPAFEGLDTLNIPVFHSARWNHDVDLNGKRIAVIGNAASAVQFIPEIAKEAEEVFVFQRSANWMLPKQDRMYKGWEKALVKRIPILLRLYRLRLWLLGGGLFFLMKSGNNLLRKFYQWRSKKYIQEHINDENLVEKLVPAYPMGAKRVLFSDTYYAALARGNVNLITGGLTVVDDNKVIAGEDSYEVDVIVFATGFKTNPFLMNINVQGKDGRSLKRTWKNGPKNYLGISVSGFPNFYMMYGPNTNLGHNSIIIMSEAQADYVAQSIDHLVQNNAKSLEVKEEVMNDYFNDVQKRLDNMIWAQVGDSWYRSADGTIPNNYPSRTMEYIKKTKNVDFGKYDLV